VIVASAISELKLAELRIKAAIINNILKRLWSQEFERVAGDCRNSHLSETFPTPLGQLFRNNQCPQLSTFSWSIHRSHICQAAQFTGALFKC